MSFTRPTSAGGAGGDCSNPNGSYFSSRSPADTPVSSPSILSSTSQSSLKYSKNEAKDIKENFTRLDVASKTLMYEAFQTLKVFRERPVTDEGWMEEQSKIYSLMGEVKENLEEMKSISDDMNSINERKISSPRIVDQAKTYALSVEGLKTSLRQLQMDFQHIINSKQRQDLFTLSKSPFENTNMPRKRVGGAADITSGATESMLHSRRILLETVQRSAGTISQLANSSSAIQENQEELKSQNSLISVSKKLLGKYGRREWTDRILIFLGIIFFFSVVLYVIQKRFF